MFQSPLPFVLVDGVHSAGAVVGAAGVVGVGGRAEEMRLVFVVGPALEVVHVVRAAAEGGEGAVGVLVVRGGGEGVLLRVVGFREV